MRLLLVCLLAPVVLLAQDNPLSAFNKMAYGQVKMWLLGSAEKMPEPEYAFKPTPAVRSFGQMVGHVADAQHMFCSVALGEQNPNLKIEQTKTSKADLIAALKQALTYCAKAYDSMTDAAATQKMKLFDTDLPKLDVMTVNIMHSVEHYGNMMTYLRMKNIVPPSSDPPTPAAGKK
jgi:uncharacterized damage-inducible protein DinB